MPVTAGKTEKDISQRKQYAKGGLGRRYWDLRDRAALQYLRGESMLDAGCGEGITLEKIMTTFPQARVEGLDSDPENIAICRTHNLPAVQGSLYNLPYPNEDFDSCLNYAKEFVKEELKINIMPYILFYKADIRNIG